MSIVTLALAKAHMNVDGTADDELITLYIGAAEQWLSNYIGRPLADLDPLPDDLKLAVLKLVAFHYEQREAVAFSVTMTMQLAPYGVTSIADAYRESWFGEAATDGV
ncbi:MAG: phage head-tail connector protein [Mesorhizobium sp.]|uniref:head-tail connector protein n=2 Tax=Mesorhizobium TaxID=68287 RepID=UPI000F75B53B|nr:MULTISPECIES: head-tail connector protein [unclassified Mesorhizobium]RVC62808.1 phage head-tail connector protein [Mesorhizobium sp. M00.F.Ca.ET.038.03.1.1]RVC72192.1 phage head-tail connector protein [Mesorhizobium sp. M2A.F.Ca.ET.046.02.1.1]AZO38804.1 phage head-tail connector protein [Mesorhizobium sp. M2A.F.Ca.ET.046.03.2.1]RWB43565.1 MAG: phage head-tail connector protein [Mesorhizobium sp.]RWE20404.1 MAG: phage head-tail connector protein [Mesorhizobium sp.]